ncbi:hypothetical protein [Actinoplanes sp. NBRC 103695]|uniref:hypothetical protein n=1 Tax=Actinoplanes sp. NBRC 103695 TaxID=3032202 RepID=UPI00249FC65C|nr:hypothetical protein [Actinoplanes sp. NBRC 103695]GLY93814.1 hypothetical protein Acsp02_10700 [Actinoplanes sp. NBRC 103695]
MDDGTERYRRYRRLVRAYPPGPRRDELLDTMVEVAATAGRRGPTPRERINVFGYALRTRLRRPRTIGVLVFAVVLMAAGAYLGAAAGNRIGLGQVTAQPTGDLSGIVFPGLTVWGGKPADVIESQPDGEGIEYGWSVYWVRHTDATRDVAAYTAGARSRLAAAGWATHDLEEGFWASRDGLVLRFEDIVFTDVPYYDSDGGARFSVRGDAQPPIWFDRAGAVLGAIVALLLTVYVSRRIGYSSEGNGLLGIFTGIMLLLLVPGMTLSQPPDPPGREPWWNGLQSELGAGPAYIAGFIAVLLLTVAFFHKKGLPRRGIRAAGAFLLRNERATTAAVLVLVGCLAAYGILWLVNVTDPPCHPRAGVPVAAPDSEVRDSDRVHIYVDPQATPEQRNLIVAATRRSWALGEEAELVWQPGSAEFREQYCGGGKVPAEAVTGLPHFFSVKLSYARDYPALLDEVRDQAGVLSVQRVPS